MGCSPRGRKESDTTQLVTKQSTEGLTRSICKVGGSQPG